MLKKLQISNSKNDSTKKNLFGTLLVCSLLVMQLIYSTHFGEFKTFYNYTIPLFVLISALYFIIFGINYRLFLIICLFGVFVLIHSLLLDNDNYLKSIRYFIFSSIFCLLGTELSVINEYKEKIILIMIPALVTSMGLYFYDPSILGLLDGDVYRLKLFFSEPSSLAPFIGVISIYALDKKKLLLFIPILFTVIISLSVVTLIVV